LDKLTTHTQTQHLKRKKKKRERERERERKREKERKEGRKEEKRRKQISSLTLHFEVSPQKRQKGNSATLHSNMESRSSYQAQYISLKLLSKLASFNSSLN